MNFDFLKNIKSFTKLYNFCAEAEKLVLIAPSMSVVSARKANEFVVKFIYSANVNSYDYGFTMFEMMQDVRFVEAINDQIVLDAMHYIRKMGNTAAHDSNINTDESVKVLEQLQFIVGELMMNLGEIEDYPPFVKPSNAPAAPIQPEKPAEVKEKIEKELKNTDTNPAPELVAKFAETMRKTKFNVSKDRDEGENKRLYIAACLREAGWPMVSIPNQAMPSSAAINMILDSGTEIDYVLYGKDNRPLAIVEYTESCKSPIAGRMKALKVAKELEQKHGYPPVVYYTNGYRITVIDQLGYEPRRVFQFHSMEELELLKLRRNMRQDISNPVIDDAITNRDYQKGAIKATCNAFMENRRRSLLVMATGTGKTRISISLVDVLMKAGWIKNVLFLADRTSLVRQAHKNFTKLLPSVTTSVYAGGSMERDSNARIIFSTYQTMINLIDDDTREFGIGRFDLIIIDEAHRSIFNLYSVLFDYFDSLLIGLTATPRGDENKSTYDVFGLENAHPDYAYELEQAVAEGYLVGFNVQDKTTKAMRRGVCYDDLTDEQKKKFEDSFSKYLDDPDEDHDFSGAEITSKEMMSRKVINIGTIKAMLNDLMKNGLKTEGGDKIGKSIIFASTHLEAEEIVKQFRIIYPNLSSDFCKLIDSHIAENQALIDAFSEKDKMPQIAVSVDMMDTGIDVPEVVNLVFFKKVQAKIKFLQMVGRGTRLCPNLYGPGIDKKGFLIFDYYDNFNYFSSHNTWSTIDESSNGGQTWGGMFSGGTQSQLINKTKLEIYQRLANEPVLTASDEKYRDELKNFFINSTRGLCNDDMAVQLDMAYVSKYRTAEIWDHLSKTELQEVEKHIIPLLPPVDGDVKCKNFDLMMLIVERDVPLREMEFKDIRKVRHGFGNVFKKIDALLDELRKIKTIPQILKKEQLLNDMKNCNALFDPFTLEKCEKIRKEIRELVHFIPDKKEYYIIESDDFIFTEKSEGSVAKKSYAESVKDFINSKDIAIIKLQNLDPLSAEEVESVRNTLTVRLGSEADFATLSNGKPMLAWLRSRTGISGEAINTKLGSLLDDKVLSSEQLAYMRQIISYANENGDVVTRDLQTVSPLCDVDIMALFGSNVRMIKQLIDGLHKPIMENV